MSEILQVVSDRGHWVITFVPAGEIVQVRDQEVSSKPFVKDHDVVQVHVVNDFSVDGQIVPGKAVALFLSETAALSTPHEVKAYFGARKDGISAATLRVVHDWVQKMHGDQRPAAD